MTRRVLWYKNSDIIKSKGPFEQWSEKLKISLRLVPEILRDILMDYFHRDARLVPDASRKSPETLDIDSILFLMHNSKDDEFLRTIRAMVVLKLAWRNVKSFFNFNDAISFDVITSNEISYISKEKLTKVVENKNFLRTSNLNYMLHITFFPTIWLWEFFDKISMVHLKSFQNLHTHLFIANEGFFNEAQKEDIHRHILTSIKSLDELIVELQYKYSTPKMCRMVCSRFDNLFADSDLFCK